MLDGRIVTSGGKELALAARGQGLRLGAPGVRLRGAELGKGHGMPEDKSIQELGLDEYKFGFQRSGGVLLQDPEEGHRPGDRRHDLQAQERAGVDARVPAEGARVVLREADPAVGRRPQRAGLRRDLLLHPPDGEPGPHLGRRAGRHQEHLRASSASRRPSASRSPASAPSTSPRSSTTP